MRFLLPKCNKPKFFIGIYSWDSLYMQPNKKGQTRVNPIIHIKNDEFNLLCSVPHSGTYDYIRRLKIKSLPSRTKPNISDAVASYCCFRNKKENR